MPLYITLEQGKPKGSSDKRTLLSIGITAGQVPEGRRGAATLEIKSVEWGLSGPSVLEAFGHIDEGAMEIRDIAQLAFKMGMEAVRKYPDAAFDE